MSVKERSDVLEVHSRNSDRLARTCRVAMFFLQSVCSEGLHVDRIKTKILKLKLKINFESIKNC